MTVTRFVRIIVPPDRPEETDAIVPYRQALKAEFPEIAWGKMDAFPDAAGDALYFLKVGSPVRDDLDALVAAYGELPVDVCRRAFLEGPRRGTVIEQLGALGFAGAFGHDFGLMGLTSIFEAMFPGKAPSLWKRPDGTVLYPEYSGFPMGETSIGPYVRHLIARLENR